MIFQKSCEKYTEVVIWSQNFEFSQNPGKAIFCQSKSYSARESEKSYRGSFASQPSKANQNKQTKQTKIATQATHTKQVKQSKQASKQIKAQA